MSEWISASERLPPFGKEVLVWADDGFHVCAYRKGEGLNPGDFEREDMKVIDGVTHWMPLPEPPSP